MRIKAILSSVFLLLFPVVMSQENYVIDWDYKGQSFEAFVLHAESVFPVRFYYNGEWIKDQSLGSYGNRITLNEVLDTLFSGKSIYWYQRGEGKIILTKDFAIRSTEAVTDNRNFIPGMDYSGNTGDKAPEGNLLAEIGNPASRNRPGNVSLSGYITDRETKEPVAGVTVHVPKLSAGTISNAHGFYSISLPRGSHTMRFTFIGMKERIIDLNLNDPGELNLEMVSVLTPLKEAVITAEKDIVLQRAEVGVEKVNVTSFRLMPTSMGEADITKSLLLMPGVHSVGEGSAGYNVRGGSADQNLILLYGAPLTILPTFLDSFLPSIPMS